MILLIIFLKGIFLRNLLQKNTSKSDEKQDMIIISRLWSLPNWSLTTGLKNKSKATFEIEQC
jgi:hypothetical protein